LLGETKSWDPLLMKPADVQLLLTDSNGMDSSSPYGIYVPDWSS
jgi:hypothetical protein